MSFAEKTRKVRTTSLGWMIQRIASKLDKAMSKKLAEHDLTIPQFAIMMTVLEESGLTQTQIGDRFSMPPYATSRALDQLEKSNLIERRAHPVSRRAHGIHATQDGIALAPVLHDIVGRVNGDLTVNLTPDQREFLGDLLSKIL